MNPGIVFSVGVIATPLVVGIAYFVSLRLRRDADAWAVAVMVGYSIVVVGLTLLASSASRCGTSEGRYQWQGNTCVDTKQAQR